MPEKGWSIITVKDTTKKTLLDMSKNQKKSINDIIIYSLTCHNQDPHPSQSQKKSQPFYPKIEYEE